MTALRKQMTRRSALLIAVGVLVFVSASSVAVFYAHRTFTTTGQLAVEVMNPEERAALAIVPAR